MTTDRRAYKISPSNPGSDLAGETAAAMAAASIVFRRSNPAYSRELLQHAYQVCITPLFVALKFEKFSVFLGSAFFVVRWFCERESAA